jgi:hypothetical protein
VVKAQKSIIQQHPENLLLLWTTNYASRRLAL